MMASPQCLGYQPAVKLTRSLCLPSKQDVLKEVKKLVKSIKAKGVFVATDSDPMLKELREHLKALKMKVKSRSTVICLSLLCITDWWLYVFR